MALRQSVGDLACTLLSIVRTRLELFSLEASEQKVNLIAILGMAFGALLFLTLAVLVFSIAVALYFWPTDQRRSEEHTSELQSLMRISYAVFCLKKKKEKNRNL